MKLTSKELRKNRFFVLYDKNDNPLMLIDSTKELVHIYKARIKDIVYNFNQATDNYIPVIIDGTTCKLYVFKD